MLRICVLLLTFTFFLSCAGIQVRNDAPQTGKIIVVAGSTSCGKSTTAHTLQSLLAQKNLPYALIGEDDFMATLPKQWVNLNPRTYKNNVPPEGFRFIRKDDQKGKKVVVQIGSLARKIRMASFSAINAIANEGVNVILEGVFERQELTQGLPVFKGKDVLLAYVDCSLKTAQRREKKRRGFIGLARGITENTDLPRKERFDIVVNTDASTPQEAATKIMRLQLGQ